MKIIDQSHQVENSGSPMEIMERLEKAGRTAYKSEGKIKQGSATEFLRKIILSGHESVLEHVNLSVRFITDRGVTHELVRHRLASYTQESTRYCNYGTGDLQFIRPVFWEEKSLEFQNWESAMLAAENYYQWFIQQGNSPQQARSVLPNSLKTEIIATANIREWRHIMKLRTSKAAHPQMRELMIPLLRDFKELLPDLFFDIEVK